MVVKFTASGVTWLVTETAMNFIESLAVTQPMKFTLT